MKPQDIERINELARLKKERGLTPEEAQERERLHKQYIADMRGNVEAHLSQIHIQQEDGSYRPLTRRKENEQ